MLAELNIYALSTIIYVYTTQTNTYTTWSPIHLILLWWMFYMNILYIPILVMSSKKPPIKWYNNGYKHLVNIVYKHNNDK